MQKSPWAWQSPPLDPSYSVISQSSVPHDRIWHRKLWGLESTMAFCSYALPGMADIILSCHLSLPPTSSTPIDLRLVKAAVRALRFENPTIAAKCAFPRSESGAMPRPSDGILVYEVPAGEEEVDTWLNEVVVAHPEASREHGGIETAVAAISQELGAAGRAPPTTLFELHFVSPSTGDRKYGVILRVGHALCDGIGSFLLLDMFNAKLASLMGDTERAHESIPWGEEVARLTGAIPDRVKVPWAPEKIEEDGVMLDKLREAAAIPKSIPGLDVLHPVGPASKTDLFLHALPSHTLARLTQYARSQNCTLFSIFMSALILAILRLRVPEDPTDINIGIYPGAVSLRETNLKEGEDPRGVAMAVGFHVYMFRKLERFIRSGESRQDQVDLGILANEVKGQIEEQRTYMDRVGFWGDEMMEIMGHFAAAANQRDKPREQRSNNLHTLPNISSLGVMDKQLAPFHLVRKANDTTTSGEGDGLKLTVSYPRYSVRIPYNPSVLVHPYTWQGTLYVAASFAEGYMGTVAEQEEHLARTSSPQAAGEKIDLKEEKRAPVIAFMNEMVAILEKAAGSMETRALEERPTSKASRRTSGLGRPDTSEVLGRLSKILRRLRPRSLQSADIR
ncbi:hypothetical protein OE88DRAFT_1809055 [Heliocybe sulcata]|uniref:CoA-dependent acyltransferase n=1 Tax=Heliocybe sulcata TaxID=5364 RepID=A0A5C3MWW3_9AGAM|nr:hypothetical protein OE88DRAFT_1809055 [Heliocybe sulcata]